MAKKISKHSRAARRGEVVDGEAKTLQSLPKENDDVRKSIIRTTIKNENLLAKKMENSLIRKQNRKLNNSLRHKSERKTKLDGVLAAKIQHSIDRARYVQTLRKAGWEQINKGLKIRNLDSDIVDSHIGSMEERLTAEKEESENAFQKKDNMFALLPDEE